MGKETPCAQQTLAEDAAQRPSAQQHPWEKLPKERSILNCNNFSAFSVWTATHGESLRVEKQSHPQNFLMPHVFSRAGVSQQGVLHFLLKHARGCSPLPW